jgi:hypothetical protein
MERAVYWRYEGQTFNDSRMLTVAEPDYDSSEGISVVAISDVNWNASGTVIRSGSI